MNQLNLVNNDPWLKPNKSAVEERYQEVIEKEKRFTDQGKQSLTESASGDIYYGLHFTQ